MLVLSDYNSNNVPLSINYDGGINENLQFELGPATGAYYSCSALLNGEFYVFGGSRSGVKDQVR